jgi:hypothetical protein
VRHPAAAAAAVAAVAVAAEGKLLTIQIINSDASSQKTQIHRMLHYFNTLMHDLKITAAAAAAAAAAVAVVATGWTNCGR